MYNVTLDDLEKLQELVSFRGKLCSTGSRDWKRFFVTDSEGCQIGRLSFKSGHLENIKHYKPEDMRELDESDKIFYRIYKFAQSGIVITGTEYDDFVLQAELFVEKTYAEKVAYRESLPKRKRKKLRKGNVRHTVWNLIYNFQK